MRDIYSHDISSINITNVANTKKFIFLSLRQVYTFIKWSLNVNDLKNNMLSINLVND